MSLFLKKLGQILRRNYLASFKHSTANSTATNKITWWIDKWVKG